MKNRLLTLVEETNLKKDLAPFTIQRMAADAILLPEIGDSGQLSG